MTVRWTRPDGGVHCDGVAMVCDMMLALFTQLCLWRVPRHVCGELIADTWPVLETAAS